MTGCGPPSTTSGARSASLLDRLHSVMRIGFVAQPIDTLYPPVEGGSLAIWIYQVAKRCAGKGYDTSVFANHGPRFGTASTQSEGVHYVYTPTAMNSLMNR